MTALRALKMAFADVYDELLVLFGAGFLGGALSLLLFPLPLVLGGHYGALRRAAEGRIVSFRDWLELAREHAGFFYKWVVVAVSVGTVLALNVPFYWRLGTGWGQLAGGVAAGIFLLWMLPQPFAPALFLQQPEQGLRQTLRNAAVVALLDPVSTIVMWLATALLGAILWWMAPPLVLPLPVFTAAFATRVVLLRLEAEEEAEQEEEKKQQKQTDRRFPRY